MRALLVLLTPLLLAGAPAPAVLADDDPDPLFSKWVQVDSVTTTARVRRGDRQSDGDIRFRIQWTVELERWQLATFEISNAQGIQDYPARFRQRPWTCTGLGSTDTDVQQQTDIPLFGSTVTGALRNDSNTTRTCTFTMYVDSRGNGPSADAYPITILINERLLPPEADLNDLMSPSAEVIEGAALGIRGRDWVYTHYLEDEQTYVARAPVHAMLGLQEHEGRFWLVCTNNLPCWTGQNGETGPSLEVQAESGTAAFTLALYRIPEIRRRVLMMLAPASDEILEHVAAINTTLDRFGKNRVTVEPAGSDLVIDDATTAQPIGRMPMDDIEIVQEADQLVLSCASGATCVQWKDKAPASRYVLEFYDRAPLPFLQDRFRDVARLAAGTE